MKKLNLKRPEKVEKEPRKRKVSGNKSGTRQQVASQKDASQQQTGNQDPRVGSKKPIDLGVSLKPKKPEQHKPKQAVVAPIRVAETTTETIADEQALIDLYEQELDAIEANEEFIIIAAKLEAGEEVTLAEQQKLEQAQQRHQELLDLLGYEEDDFIEDEQPVEDDDDEDALLRKFDDSEFSEFKE
ncbi:GTPase-activating protein [Thalassotalea maritima]|uniref:GTPase-activating protein n=1 Tax=Thalassotalea maritima TaxID=3242416 RepID=UPI003527CE71